jgi:HEAT repeat protein
MRSSGKKADHRLFAGIALLTAIAMCLSFAHASGADASYQGKPVSFWFELALKGTNVEMAFKAMGSNAAPFLASELDRRPSKLDEKLSDFPRKPYVPEMVYEHSLHKVVRVIDGRREAAYLLNELGPDAEPALPVLLRIFREGDEYEMVQTYVNNTLEQMRDRIAFMVPELLENLTNNQPHVRVLCARMLGSIGPKAKPAVPALLRATESGDWHGWLAYTAGKALLTIDGQTNVTLRVLTNALNGTNTTIRLFALMDLGKLGPVAKTVAPAIQEVLHDSDEQMRNEAVKALKEIEPTLLESRLQEMNQQAAANIARLIEMIRTGEYPQRYRAVEALSLFGPDAKDAVPVLIQALDAPVMVRAMADIAQHNLWRVIADALGEIGPDARAAVPKLVELIRKSKQYAGMSYCPALGKIGTNASLAVPVLQSLLQDENLRLRLAAADALIMIAPPACSNVVAVLTNLLNEPELATVWVVDEKGVARRSDRKDLQNPESVFAKISVSVALWRLGLEKEPPIEVLAELAGKDPSAGGELWAIKLLGEIGPAAKPALPALRGVLDRKSTYYGRAAAIAIRHIDRDEFDRLGLPGMLALP